MRSSYELQVTEIDGHRFATLAMAQDAALTEVARALATAIREGITDKNLLAVDGIVTFNNDSDEE
jgi:hypothetical protein